MPEHIQHEYETPCPVLYIILFMYNVGPHILFEVYVLLLVSICVRDEYIFSD